MDNWEELPFGREDIAAEEPPAYWDELPFAGEDVAAEEVPTYWDELPFAGEAPPISVVGWTASGVGRVNFDVVLSILMQMLPSVLDPHSGVGWGTATGGGWGAGADAPNGGWVTSWGGAPAYLSWIVNAMQVSRPWYAGIRRAAALWGGMLSGISSPIAWRQVCDLARSAPKRLRYGARTTWARMDTQLETAGAIYADSSCPWRDFGEKLQGLEMPLLEVVLVRTDESEMPASLPASPRRPIVAHSLVVCEISSPAVFIARNLRRLVMSNFWDSQLRDALRVLSSLVHLEIHRTRSNGGVDWTSVLSSGGWEHLEVLVIWSTARQSLSLPSDAMALDAPRLHTMNVGGAVLMRSSEMRSMHVERVAFPGLIRMLREAPSLVHLSVRTLMDGHWHALADEGPENNRVELRSLEEVTVYSALSEHTQSMLDLVHIPALREISLFFDATGPPNRQALHHVDQFLGVSLNLGVVELQRAFAWARVAFEQSGYAYLSQDLDSVLAPLEGWGAPVNVQGALRNAALWLREIVRATAADPPMGPHPGEVLRGVVAAAMAAADIDAETADCVLCVNLDDHAVRYKATIESFMEDESSEVCSLELLMTGPPLPPAARPRQWERKDSLAAGGARVLFGLSVLPVVEISVTVGEYDPFNAYDGAAGEDIDELASSLAFFTAVDVLRFEINPQARGTALLRAISLPVLASLTHLYVTRQAMDNVFAAAGRPLYMKDWFNLLESALTRRAEEGMRLEWLDIRGHFCICSLWETRVRGVVGHLELEVTCARRVDFMCLVCEAGPGWW
ncbi:hypothetical protein PENSPDRAFT_694794 [Peniophora sp. CONT]|nr:hypothetical protein PENSPDRAFT_694794 [Peniophora sp. CONT]